MMPLAKSNSRQAGGTASGSERREGPTAVMSRRRDAIPSRWRQCVHRGVSFSIAGDDWIIDRTGIQAAQIDR